MYRVGAIAIVLLLGLWAGLALAQSNSATPIPYVYRLKIGNCTFDPDDRRQTGFRVQGIVGIVTALHGVVGCKTASAIAEDGTIFVDLFITATDIERDMALLTSPILNELPKDGLSVSVLSNTEILSTSLRIVGYPLALDKQDMDKIESVRDIESLDDVIPDSEETVEFIKRNSPNIRINVLNLQAQLVPGHSGAPLIDTKGDLVAVGDGGLRGGTVGRSWAIPWQDIDLQSVDNEVVTEKLEELIAKGTVALTFSSTYPSQDRSLIPIGPLPATPPTMCYALWDCRTSKISAWLFGQTPSAIDLGDTTSLTAMPLLLPTSTPSFTLPETLPNFTGVGFPGLVPVDFSAVAKVPLLPDTVMTGILPTGNQILGFTLDAAAGDTLDLSYTRVSGNMNLGLVVLSESNEVFFQASLVTSASLATQFTLPAAGQYTIGVFRISLVEPAEVEPTVFQLKVTTME